MVRVQPLDCDFTLEAPERNRAWYESRGCEPMSTALFRTAVARADVVLDIGAHVGYYTLLAASACPTASIVAVEASPANAEVLQRNVDAAGHPGVRVVTAAFGATTGQVTIQLTEASDNNGLSGHPNSPTTGTVEVPAVTGADLDLPPGGKLSVKLDVEGHELGALTGLAGVFAQYEDVRLLIELNPKCLTAAGSSADEIVERLRTLDFRIFLLDEEQRSWHELRQGEPWAELLPPGGYANLYCVTADRCHTVSAVLHSSGLGGAERSHTEIVESLVRQGSMVHTVLPEQDLGLRAEVVRLGGSVTPLPALEWWVVRPDGNGHGPDAWEARTLVSAQLVGALAAVGPDVVLTQSGVVPQGALAAAALGLPHVWYLREFGDLDHGLVLPGGREAFGEMVRALSDRVVTNSSAVRDHLVGAHDDVTVLHPAPQVGLGAPGADGPTRSRERRTWTVGIVGSLNPGKGQADAVVAMARLRDEGVEAALVLVGPGEPEDRERLRELAGGHDVTDLLEFREPERDRAEMYARFDAVAVTSRSEAFGRVPFEAAAVGLPVVYAEAGGMTEYLRPGVTGLPYPPGDPDALAAAFRSLAGDPALGRRLAAAAREELLGPQRLAEFDRAVLAVVADAAARGGTADPRRALVRALAREAADQAEAAARWQCEAAGTHKVLSGVVAEHEALVTRIHDLEALVTRIHDLEAERGRLVEGQEKSRANNAQLRSELADALEASSHGIREAAELRADLGLIRASRTWRARERVARLVRRGR